MSDIRKNKCGQCGSTITEYVVRESLKVKLNGPGGAFEDARPEDGDVIKCYFQLNDGPVSRVPGQYNVTESAADGRYLACYMIFKVGEELEPVEE